jgi:hypothetical protein
VIPGDSTALTGPNLAKEILVSAGIPWKETPERTQVPSGDSRQAVKRLPGSLEVEKRFFVERGGSRMKTCLYPSLFFYALISSV